MKRNAAAATSLTEALKYFLESGIKYTENGEIQEKDALTHTHKVSYRMSNKEHFLSCFLRLLKSSLSLLFFLLTKLRQSLESRVLSLPLLTSKSSSNTF